MGTMRPCDACQRVQDRDTMTQVAGPGGTYQYCRDTTACKERTNQRYNITQPTTKETNMTLPQHSRFNWDNPEYRAGDYWKWDKPGDAVTGTITNISTHTFPAKQQADGTMSQPKTVPVIAVNTDDGNSIEVTCSNADLLEQVRVAAPQVGDHIHMEYLREVATSFGGKKKLFHVKHQKATFTEAAAASAPEAGPQQSEAPF